MNRSHLLGRPWWLAVLLILVFAPPGRGEKPPERNHAYRELTGTVEEFTFLHYWRSYYWVDDFTLLVRDDAGELHRVISREPTPWNNYRLGTTYTGLAVDWTSKPRVQVIGVEGIDRIPPEFPDRKLGPARTMTAFILRVGQGGAGKPAWRDFYVNNWFHHWGDAADRKVLANYAKSDPHYSVYGYLKGIAAPFDAEGRKLLAKFEPDYGGIIYHGRVVKAANEAGYEVHLLHLMGRHKKTLNYDVFHGDARELVQLDGKPPRGGKK